MALLTQELAAVVPRGRMVRAGCISQCIARVRPARQALILHEREQELPSLELKSKPSVTPEAKLKSSRGSISFQDDHTGSQTCLRSGFVVSEHLESHGV